MKILEFIFFIIFSLFFFTIIFSTINQIISQQKLNNALDKKIESLQKEYEYYQNKNHEADKILDSLFIKQHKQ